MLSRTMKSLFCKSLRRNQIAIMSIIAISFVSIVTLAIYEGNKTSVTLSVNGEKLEVRTYANTVGHLLSEQEIEVAEHDLISPSVNTPIEDGLSVRWEQSKQIAIQVDEEDLAVWTTKKTVGEVLEEAGIELTEHDAVSPDVRAQLGDNDKIAVEKAYEFTLVDGGEKKKYWSTATTVGDFLKKENIQLDELDRLEGQQVEDVVEPDAVVQIVRVEKVIDVVEEDMNYAVETRSDNTLLKGKEKVVQEGKKGKVSREYAIVKEDGKEISRTTNHEKVIQEPTKKIVAVGSKVLVASAASSGGSGSAEVSVSRSNAAPAGGKEFYVSATAYTAHCNGCSGITSTGINLRANPNTKVIAVDPNVIPLGSKVWVEGYGYAIAGDTGGAIKGNKIDLHFPTKQAAYKFGRRQVKVKVIN